MAYSATYSPANKTTTSWLIGGRRYFEVTITQVEVDPSDPDEHEWSLNVPPFIEVLAYQVEVTDDNSGAVTGVTPQLGVAAGWTADTADHRLTLTPDPAALYAASYEQPVLPVTGGVLYGRPVPNIAGGTMVTRIVFAEGAS